MDLIKYIFEWIYLYILYKSNIYSDWISFLISGRCFILKMLNKKVKIICNIIYSKWKFWNFFVLFFVFVIFCLRYFVCDIFCWCYFLFLLYFFCVFFWIMLFFVYVIFCRLLIEIWRIEFYRWIFWWRYLVMLKLLLTIILVDLENILKCFLLIMEWLSEVWYIFLLVF